MWFGFSREDEKVEGNDQRKEKSFELFLPFCKNSMEKENLREDLFGSASKIMAQFLFIITL